MACLLLHMLSRSLDAAISGTRLAAGVVATRRHCGCRVLEGAADQELFRFPAGGRKCLSRNSAAAFRAGLKGRAEGRLAIPPDGSMQVQYLNHRGRKVNTSFVVLILLEHQISPVAIAGRQLSLVEQNPLDC